MITVTRLTLMLFLSLVACLPSVPSGAVYDNPPPPTTAVSRPTIDEVDNACWWVSTSAVDALISNARSLQREGGDKVRAQTAVMLGCADAVYAAAEVECWACGTAVNDYVYGY